MSDTIKGAVLMMGAMAGFVINDAFMRTALEELPIFQAIFLRGLVLLPVLALVAWRSGALGYRPQPRDRQRIWLRSLSEMVGTFIFMTALTRMPFANVSAIMQAIPLAVTLGAALYLGAPIGWRRIAAILIGFLGVLMIVRPGAADFNMASLLIVAVVGIVVVRDLAARVLSPGVPSTFVAVHAAAIVTLGFGVMSLTENWAPLSVQAATCLAAAALLIAAGYLCSVATMRIGDIAVIAPFRYTALLWAILIGTLVFKEPLDRWTMLGASLIVAMGLFSLFRERRLARRAQSS